MPLYDIEYVIPLTDEQQEQLAKEFTRLHCSRFHTPSFFINVRFTDASKQKVYRGGALRFYNRAILRTRVSENRSKETYGQHCRDIIKAWDDIVNGKEAESISPNDITALRTVWVMGALTTAVELGIQRPGAGEEIQWLKENRSRFEELAMKGDEDMRSLLEEIDEREDLRV